MQSPKARALRLRALCVLCVKNQLLSKHTTSYGVANGAPTATGITELAIDPLPS